MHIVFYSTNDVFRAEDILSKSGIECKIVPTPAQDKAYCGVCVETSEDNSLSLLNDMEYKVLD